MSLSNLIKKGVSGVDATAIPAIPAIHTPQTTPKIAKIARIAAATDRKIKIIRDEQGRETGFEAEGPPTQPGAPTPEPTFPESFDADGWAERISQTVEAVAAADRGALAHCRAHAPELHRKCVQSGRLVDDAFEAGDESSLACALERFEALHQEARQFFQGGGHDPD